MINKLGLLKWLSFVILMSSACGYASADELKLRVSSDKNYIYIDVTNLGDKPILLNRRMPDLGAIGDLETSYVSSEKTFRMRGLNELHWDKTDFVEVWPMHTIGITLHKSIEKDMFGLTAGCFSMNVKYTNKTTKPKKLITVGAVSKVCFE
ncbi:MAG: hypothetical protein ACREPB_05980 [Arenimonas sp.]